MSASSNPCLLRFGRIGDMVLQSVLLHLLSRRYGRACTLIGTGSWSRDLFDAAPEVAHVECLRWRHAPFALNPEHWRLIRRLQNISGPIYVSEEVPRQLEKIRWLLTRAGIPDERCVFPTVQTVAARHWVDRLNLLGALTPREFEGRVRDAGLGDFLFAPRLHVALADRDDCTRWLHARGWTGLPIVLIQPGNRRNMRRFASRKSDPKAWPLQHWCDVLRFIRERMKNAQILLCGAPAESRMLKQICAASGVDCVEVVTHQLPLRRFMALAERAHSMISIDTGPAHIAAALGCPLVVLYGAEPVSLWRRRSPFDVPIVELGGEPESISIKQLSPEAVMEAWSSMIAAPCQGNSLGARLSSSTASRQYREKQTGPDHSREATTYSA